MVYSVFIDGQTYRVNTRGDDVLSFAGDIIHQVSPNVQGKDPRNVKLNQISSPK